ncbi:MAG TPA: hypothetical protein EYN66_01800 [Myxococcales bacterium]|nr:hypothetical protein [Myxococcales bacterium]
MSELERSNDPEKKEQALAHGSEYALSYLDRTLAPAVRNILLTAADSFDGQNAAVAGPQEAIESLRTLLPAEATLTVRCTLPVDQHLPRWPGTLRTGPVMPLEQGLWPYDPEAAAMLAGRRRLIKREWLTSEQQEKDAAWLAQHDLIVESADSVDSRGRFALFAAADDETLQNAHAAEAALCASDTERESAAAWLGEALGYPSCCVNTFQRLGRRDDLTLAMELLPTVDASPASPLTQWLHGPLALISHTPCSLECGDSMALAKAVLQELERERPGFSARWEQLTRRIQLVDVHGNSFALRATGELSASVVVEDAVRFSLPSADSFSEVMESVPEFAGRTFHNVQGALVSDGFRAVVLADHRRAI